MSTKQVNVRVPDDARDVVQAVATRLRADCGFADKLREWLASESTGAGPGVQADVDELRARVEALEAQARRDGPARSGG